MQDAMWPFVTLIYANQGPETEQDWLTDDLLEEAATKLGLDVDKWKTDYAGEPWPASSSSARPRRTPTRSPAPRSSW